MLLWTGWAEDLQDGQGEGSDHGRLKGETIGVKILSTFAL